MGLGSDILPQTLTSSGSAHVFEALPRRTGLYNGPNYYIPTSLSILEYYTDSLSIFDC